VSFRRDREAGSAWRRWVTAHEAELVAIGVPREVWADEMTWWRFLWHRHHPSATDARDVRFRLDDLSPGQQVRFYRFLEATLTERERAGNDVWGELRRRFGAVAEEHAD
jgi:hypothetical protein